MVQKFQYPYKSGTEISVPKMVQKFQYPNKNGTEISVPI